MANIHSFPVQQQQQLPPNIQNDPDMFYAHFGARPVINRMFAWSNTLYRTYSGLIWACTVPLFWLPIMNGDPEDIVGLPLLSSNISLTENQIRGWNFVRRCTLSSSITIDNISSYEFMKLLIIFFCLCSNASVLVSQHFYETFSNNERLIPYRWFCWCRKILIFLVSASICNQLASVFGCRSIDILYDIRYILMFITQTIGFFICLIFAFFLGVKYASVKYKD